MLGLVADTLRAKMAKEAISFLKGVSRSQASGSHDNRTRHRFITFPGLGALVTGVADASKHLCLTFHSCFVVFLLFSFLPLGWVVFSLSVDLGGTSSVSQFRTWVGAWGQRGLGSRFLGYACDLFYFFLSFFVVF